MEKNTTYIPSKEAQQKIVTMITAQKLASFNMWQRRDFLESIDRAYYRESDNTEYGLKAKAAVEKGDITKFRNIIAPVILSHVESAVSFQTSIFLQGHPIFATAAPAKFQAAASQMDALIEDQQHYFGWVNEFQKIFRDAFKYNIAAMHANWETVKLFTPEGGTEQVYAGNNLTRMDLYNTYWDPTVEPSKCHNKGEYAGFIEMFSPINLYRELDKFEGIFNKVDALKSIGSTTESQYYIPKIADNVFVDPKTTGGVDWRAFFTGGESSTNKNATELLKGMLQLTTAYAWVIPASLGMVSGIENSDSVQLWRFMIVNDSVLVQAVRMTNAHNNLPIVVTQGIDDGLGYQTKSLAQNVMPMQDIITALFNANIQARRKSLSGTPFYDPHRIDKADMESNYGKLPIPVKRSSFDAKDISTAVFSPNFDSAIFRENMTDFNTAMQMADQITGRNPARQGQFVKGNKTREEFASTMANAEGRDITTSLSLEGSLMRPIKEIIKANILQFQDLKSLYNSRLDEVVEIEPKELRNATLTFKLADGINPISKVLSSEALSVAFQTLQSVPDLGQHYNTAGIFGYLMETQGAKIEQFQKPEEMVAYEQAMGQWQQAVAMMAEQIGALKDITMEDIEKLIQQIPPQPTPEQFGWDPSKQLKDVGSDTVSSLFAKSLRESQGNNQASQEGAM